MAIDIDKLMSGVGIIIDDAFRNDKDKKDDIFKIVEQIEDKNIPLVKYDDLPDDAVPHFKNVSFILLDWNLNQVVPSTVEPVIIPSGLETSNIKQNIKFIENIQKVCFTPLFIFTKEDTDGIINILIDAGLYTREKRNFIFVKNKSEIKKKGSLFLEIANWLKETSSIYVLKEWEISLNCAKNELFWDFYDLNPDWPKVLWKAYKQDEVDMTTELGELITRNLKSRMSHFGFDKQILSKNISQIEMKDLISVMAGDRFMPDDKLNKKEINTGDIYKDKNGKYLLNIRPQCDLISRGKNNYDATILYLIEGECIGFPSSKNKLKSIFNIEGGNFKESISEAILFPIEESIIKFSFKNQINKSFRSLKSRRVGRVLPPYITRIQQRYALYLQREGIPRTPEEAIFISSNGGLAR
ncbi:MAG: hypothetical protein ACUZ8E_10335 [Candidatus Anammoxibacter sp.]